MYLFPLIIVGGAAYYFGKRRQRKKDKKAAKKALPAAQERGVIFPAGEVDIIRAKVGDRFTVSIPERMGTGYAWSLEATPPGNSIELLKEEFEGGAAAGMDGGGESHLFIFKAKKTGAGALVFHYMRGFEKGQVPPEKVLEIQTQVS